MTSSGSIAPVSSSAAATPAAVGEGLGAGAAEGDDALVTAPSAAAAAPGLLLPPLVAGVAAALANCRYILSLRASIEKSFRSSRDLYPASARETRQRVQERVPGVRERIMVDGVRASGSEESWLRVSR